MRVSITLKNTRGLTEGDWNDLVLEVADAISDHSITIRSTSAPEPGVACWVAEFIASDAAFAKVALREIVTNPDGSEYAGFDWLGVTDVVEATV